MDRVLRRLGYPKEEMTAHGFRSIASALLNEQGWSPDLIELQLAHQKRNRGRAAYKRAQVLEEREFPSQAAWLKRLVLREIRACDVGRELEAYRVDGIRRPSGE